MKIAIQGHPTRGKEVIQILENMGGINIHSLSGICSTSFYYVNKNNYIKNAGKSLYDHTLYTLEEFEKEFPFKIGDRVISTTTNFIGTVIKLTENGCYYVRSDNGTIAGPFGKNLKLYNEMKQERNVTLTLDKAKEWYKKGGELKEVALQAFTEEELTKKELPKTWEEFCEKYPVKAGESWIGSQNVINTCVSDLKQRYCKNWLPSRKSAEAHLAMMQLEQLRDCWRQGWKPIWDISEKWCIRLWGNELSIGVTTNISRFLTFPTKEMAEEFLKCFRDLIEKARNLI